MIRDASHRTATPRAAPRRVAPQRLAPHRIAAPRSAPHRFASPLHRLSKGVSMTTRFQTTPERTEKLEKIVGFLKKKKAGETITWLDVERATGIQMSSDDGRALVRHVLMKVDPAYESIAGTGFRLSSAASCFDIVQHEWKKLGRAIKRGEKKRSHLVAAHGDKMTSTQRDAMERAGSINAMLLATAPRAAKALKP